MAFAATHTHFSLFVCLVSLSSGVTTAFRCLSVVAIAPVDQTGSLHCSAVVSPRELEKRGQALEQRCQGTLSIIFFSFHVSDEEPSAGLGSTLFSHDLLISRRFR